MAMPKCLTDEDKEYILQVFGEKPVSHICRIIGRSSTPVRNFLHSVGLIKVNKRKKVKYIKRAPEEREINCLCPICGKEYTQTKFWVGADPARLNCPECIHAGCTPRRSTYGQSLSVNDVICL